MYFWIANHKDKISTHNSQIYYTKYRRFANTQTAPYKNLMFFYDSSSTILGMCIPGKGKNKIIIWTPQSHIKQTCTPLVFQKERGRVYFDLRSPIRQSYSEEIPTQTLPILTRKWAGIKKYKIVPRLTYDFSNAHQPLLSKSC